MEVSEVDSCMYNVLTHAPSHSNLSLCFWLHICRLCSLTSHPCGSSLAVTSMFCLVNSHSRHSFRSTEGSEYPLYHHKLEGAFTNFLYHLLYFCCYFSFERSLVLPQFFPLPDPSYHYIIFDLGSTSLYYNLCHFYHSQWLPVLLPPGVLLSFNFDTCLHYPTERNSRGLE